MATTATSPHLPSNSSAVDTSESSRWSGINERRMTFRGLARGTRGRGSGRGRGRGGKRVVQNSVSGDKIADDANNTTTSTSRSVATPAGSPISLPSVSPTEKAVAPPSSKSKGAGRRASRTILPPPAIKVDNTNEAQTAQGSSRRRRSQSNKGSSVGLPKIQVHAQENENSPRGRAGTVSHLAPIKDVPPHLAGVSFDVRHDIDALVERVRAVAMGDNRPSTPGSHIDWAGEEDDSLPDLNDWGVSTPSLVKKAELMSPIVIADLKPLPGLEDSPSEETATTFDSTAPSSGLSSALPDHPTSNQSKSPRIAPSINAAPVIPSPPVLQRSHSTPDRKRAAPKRERKPVLAKKGPSSALASAALSAEKSDEKAAEPEEATPEGEYGLRASIHAPKLVVSTSIESKEPSGTPGLTGDSGLSMSIHAPHSITESIPIPNDLSASPSKSERRTHIRTRTVGRSFQSDNLGRPLRSGHSPLGLHTRTQSSPIAGTSHRNNHTQRPILTGDALSRLAKTIGGASVSPPKPTAIASHD